MKTKDFAMGFFGRIPFEMDERKGLFKNWSEMSNEEKLECVNKRMKTFKYHDHEPESFAENANSVSKS